MATMTISESESEKFRKNIAETLCRLEVEARLHFLRATERGVLRTGRYEDLRWDAPQCDLIFTPALGVNGKFFPAHAVYRDQYEDPRCVSLLKAYTATKLELTNRRVIVHTQAVKLLLHMIGNNVDGLALLTRSRLENGIREYQQVAGGTANGIEAALAGENGFIGWLRRNGMLLFPFTYTCVLSDEHKLASRDTTSPQAAAKANRKRPPLGLETALGEVLAKTENGQNEPKVGIFRLRALLCVFMMAAGLRFGEGVTLPVNCFEEFNGRTWLKVFSEKGSEPRLVPLGAGWDDLLKRYHREALDLTRTAREAACALENGTLFDSLRSDIERVAGERVRRRDAEAVGEPPRVPPGYFPWSAYVEVGVLAKLGDHGRAYDPLVEAGIRVGRGPGLLFISFAAFESWFRERQCERLSKHYGSVVTGECIREPLLRRSKYEIVHPLSQHLFLKMGYQFHKERPTLDKVASPITHQELQRFLRSGATSVSVFEALNIRRANGEFFELGGSNRSSHAFRHWKDDARFRAGGNEIAIAKLAGRTPCQNRAYDMRTAAEIADQHRELYLQSAAEMLPADLLGRRVREMLAIGCSRAEVEALLEERLQVMHLTPWGGCSRDLDREPCPMHYKCLRGFEEEGMSSGACANFHIDPTDLEAKATIEYTLELSRAQLLALTRLMMPENLDKTLQRLEMDWNPERGHSVLTMQMRHLDQLVRGCEAALRTYESGSVGAHVTRGGKRLLQVASSDRIPPVTLIDPAEVRK